MMVNAKRDKVKKFKVTSRELGVYKDEYIRALAALKESVAGEE